GVTQRDEQLGWPLAVGDILQHIARGGERDIAQLDAGAIAAHRRVQHETAVRLDRPAKKHQGILYLARIQREIEVDALEQISDRDVSWAVDDQTERAVSGVLTNVNHCIGQLASDAARHCHQQLPGQVYANVGLRPFGRGTHDLSSWSDEPYFL